MKIVVNRASVVDGVCRVEFSSEHGRAWAYWRGEVPAVGLTHDVEIDLPREAIVSIEAAPEGVTSPTVCVQADGTIAVRCTPIGDDDGCVSFRFGHDILRVETDWPAPPGGVAVAVVVESRSMELYPYDT